MKNKISLFIIPGFLVSILCGCNSKAKDISIIYTTDIHCGISDNLTYSSVVAYKDELSKTNYVSLVDAGDYLQGNYVGAISKGEYIVEVMNKAGYDVVTLGNHEFDYGMDELASRLTELNSDIVSCNFSYIGNKSNKFTMVKPYVIKEYGSKKIGYVGVTTPHSLTDSDPKNFLEDDKIAYTFGESSKENFYNIVQENIDNCKRDGADYVLILSHLGSLDNYSPYSSLDLIANTSGYLAVLDGHAHISMPWKEVKDKNNNPVQLVDTGYKLNNFASLTIKTDGSVSYNFITQYDAKSEVMDAFIKDINAKADETGNKVVATIDVSLKTTNEKGTRLVRARETPIGNLIADAYRNISGADIGIVNGGGIRSDLAMGDVTYRQIMNVHPFGNTLMKKKVSGSQILDHLEFASMNTTSDIGTGEKATGESGAFVNASGLIYTIDTSIPTSVVVDEKGYFVKVGGPRRVKDVKVLVNSEYQSIDPNKEYILASNNFLLNNGGDGANMYMNDEVVPSEQKFDYEVVIDYIVDVLKGQLKDKYSSVEGRINVI